MTSWWSTATTEQKLAQIDGAIELEMTSREAGKNLGVCDDTVLNFAREHGRKFVRWTQSSRSKLSAKIKEYNSFQRDKKDFFAGTRAGMETVFGALPDQEPLLEDRGEDSGAMRW